MPRCDAIERLRPDRPLPFRLLQASSESDSGRLSRRSTCFIRSKRIIHSLSTNLRSKVVEIYFPIEQLSSAQIGPLTRMTLSTGQGAVWPFQGWISARPPKQIGKADSFGAP